MFWWKILNLLPQYKGFVKRKKYLICYMVGNLLIYETILVFFIKLKVHFHSLTCFQISLVFRDE